MGSALPPQRLYPPPVPVPLLRGLVATQGAANILRRLGELSRKCLLLCIVTSVEHHIDQGAMLLYVWDLFELYKELVISTFPLYFCRCRFSTFPFSLLFFFRSVQQPPPPRFMRPKPCQLSCGTAASSTASWVVLGPTAVPIGC